MEKERSPKSAFDFMDYWNPSWPRRTLSRSAFAQSYVHRLQLEHQSKPMFSAIRYEGGFACTEENRFVLCQRYAGQLFGLRFVPQHLAKLRWELRTLDLCRGHPSFPQRPGILSTAPPERRNRRELLGRANETVVLEDCLCCWMKHSRSQAFVMKKVLFQPIEAYEGKRSLDLKDVNMYHLGAVRYNMLTLGAPFQSLSPLALMTNLCEVRFDKERRHYARLSSAAKQIVEGQLLLDPTKRWPMTQLLRHAWFGGRNKEKREAEADRLFELLRK